MTHESDPSTGDPTVGGGAPDAPASDPEGARRRFLTKGAVAAAAAAAGVVALADTAGAADGNALLIGSANSGNGIASLTSLSASRLQVSSTATSFAVRGVNSGGGVGVLGETTGSSASTGVVGRSGAGTDGVGVLGETSGSSAGTGVYGRSGSAEGVGVLGEGGSSTLRGTGVVGRSDRGPSLRLDAAAVTVPPTTGSWSAGSFMVSNGHVYYCWRAGTGTAAQWVKLSGAPIILPTGYRAYDSRPGKAPLGVTKGALANGQTRANIDLKVGSGGALPSGISAVLLNLTATATNSAGYLSAFRSGTAWPGTSTVNWSAANSNIANTTIVPVDASSRISLYCSGSAQALIDVIGFLP